MPTLFAAILLAGSVNTNNSWAWALPQVNTNKKGSNIFTSELLNCREITAGYFTKKQPAVACVAVSRYSVTW